MKKKKTLLIVIISLIVILLIAAAIITPTSDPFTLFVVFLPLYMLYELSALFVKPKAKENDI